MKRENDNSNRKEQARDATASPEKVRRREPKELRREQLITATIDAIAEHGYAATTMAHITDNAGLSRGIVNFHFESKESLFVETLRFMADEYAEHWQAAVSSVGDDAAARLLALIIADFSPAISSRRKIATWIAFRAEAVSNAAYRELCWSRDDAFLQAIGSSCAQMKAEAGYHLSPEHIASAIYAMQEGLWLRMLLERNEMSRETATATALGIIAPVFPKHFNPDGSLVEHPKVTQ